MQPQLDKLDMKKLLEKGEDEEEDDRTDADQIKGVGYHGYAFSNKLLCTQRFLQTPDFVSACCLQRPNNRSWRC